MSSGPHYKPLFGAPVLAAPCFNITYCTLTPLLYMALMLRDLWVWPSQTTINFLQVCYIAKHSFCIKHKFMNELKVGFKRAEVVPVQFITDL